MIFLRRMYIFYELTLLWSHAKIPKTKRHFDLKMKKRELKKKSNAFMRRLLDKDCRQLIIRAGFPYHKSPHLYQWLWVFILLPFLPEDTPHSLSDKQAEKNCVGYIKL